MTEPFDLVSRLVDTEKKLRKELAEAEAKLTHLQIQNEAVFDLGKQLIEWLAQEQAELKQSQARFAAAQDVFTDICENLANQDVFTDIYKNLAKIMRDVKVAKLNETCILAKTKRVYRQKMKD